MAYLFAFLILTGLLLHNLSICRYFNEKISALVLYCKIKPLNMILNALAIFPILFLLPFLLWFSEVFLICFAWGITLFAFLIICYDYIIYKHDKEYVALWQRWSFFEKSFGGILIIILASVYYYNPSLKNTFNLININLFFVYIFLLKKLSSQHKKSPIFSNKYFNFFEVLISKISYFIAWGIMLFYTITMAINIVLQHLDRYDVASCIDVGICKEGIGFDNCNDRKNCIITKEYCINNGYEWMEKIHSCNIRKKN